MGLTSNFILTKDVKLQIANFFFQFFKCKLLFCVSVCHLLRSGVAALFGPQSGTTSSHVQSICDAMEIPHIETRWDYRLKRDDYSVNLYPHPTAISKVRSRHLVTKMKTNYRRISNINLGIQVEIKTVCPNLF